MARRHRNLIGSLLLLLCTGPLVFADDPAPAAAQRPAGFVKVAGRVVQADGSPAASVIVQQIGASEDRPNTTRTDEKGVFEIRGIFGNGCRLQATTADGSEQATLMIAASAVRRSAIDRVELRLRPSVAHEVTVVANEQPVEGAVVVSHGNEFRWRAMTSRDGKAILRVPAGKKLDTVVAWHPRLGVAGKSNLSAGLPEPATRLPLSTPAPHTVRVVDDKGKGVDSLELAISVSQEGAGWAVSSAVEEARVRTDSKGEVVVPWIPRDALQFVDVNPVDADWKVDEIDRKRLGEQVTTVHVRRQRSVLGRVILPEGANAEGILISGFGFGLKNRGYISYARARRDGWFSLQVPADHGTFLGIADLDWASALWTGVVLLTDDSDPAQVILEAYPATPTTLRVTRGSDRAPVVDAWLEVGHEGDVNWVDSSGEKHSGSAGVESWFKTDERGEVQAGVGRGKQKFRLAAGRWNEQKMIEVGAADPLVVEFHRPWSENRRVSIRVIAESGPYGETGGVVAWALADQLRLEPERRPDGTFEVTFDADNLSVLAIDTRQRRSGHARIGADPSSIDLKMLPMATYGGTLLDENGRPAADRTLRLETSAGRAGPGAGMEAAAAQVTDPAGRFRFPIVPAGVALDVRLQNEPKGDRYFLSSATRQFEPGEVREGDRLAMRRAGNVQAPPRPSPLADRIAGLCRNTGLAGMLGLVVLQGDDTPAVAKLTEKLLDYDVPDVLRYLPAIVTPEQLGEVEKVAGGRAWPKPAQSEVVIVAVDAQQQMISAERFQTGNVAEALVRNKAFLARHAAPGRDAKRVLTEAKKEAAASERRILFVEGGARCGPCFKLAAWMDERKQTLEKDYVIVKVVGGVDERVEEVMRSFPVTEGSGIPWFAILGADGTTLITSEGPLGNTGLPQTVEELRHFRRMLETTAKKMTPADIDELIKSLSTGA